MKGSFNKLLILFLIAAMVGVFSVCALGEGVRVLLYHHLVEGEPASEMELSREDFAAQMDYLYQHGYQVLSLEEFIEFYNQGEFPADSVLITFDDGYYSFYSHAYPVLLKYDFPAVIFPVIEYMPGLEREQLYTDYLSFHHLRLMDRDSGLVETGSHTYNLHYLTEEGLPAVKQKEDEGDEEYRERIMRDLRVSRDLLELQLDQKIISLAWPFGEDTELARELAEKLGYQLLFSGHPGVVTPETDLGDIPRYSVFRGDLDYFNRLMQR